MSKKFLSVLIGVILSAAICVFSSAVIRASEEIRYLEEEKAYFVTLTRKAEPKKDLPTNVSVITEREIEQIGARNAAEAIDYLASIDIGQYGTLGSQTSARIRNSTANQVQILINGTPLTGVSFGSANLSQIPVDNIERVEIVRGASSVLYGANAVSGVINIITKKPKSPVPLIEFHTNYRSFDTQIYRTSIDLQKEKLGTFVIASKQKTAGFRKNSDYDNDNFSLWLEYDFLRLGKLSFRGQYSHSKVGVPGLNSTPINEYDGRKELEAETPNAKQTNTIYNLELFYEKKFPPNFNINAKLYSRINNHNYQQPDEIKSLYLSSESTKMHNYTLGADIQVNLPHNLILGYVYNIDSCDSEQLASDLDRMTGDYVYFTTSTKKELNNWAIYAQQSISLIPKLKIIPAVRFDSHQMFGDYFSPRLTATLTATKNFKFSSCIGKAFRAPNFDELYWPSTSMAVGNPILKPEESVGYDLGMEFSNGVNALRITYFRREINNQIRWYYSDPTNLYSPWTPSNVDKAIATGLETEFEYKLIKNLTHKLSWSYVNNTIKKKGEEEKGFQKSAYSPEHTFSSILTFLLPYRSSIISTMEYADKQYDLDEFSKHWDGTPRKEIPSYAIWNLRFVKKITNLELFIEINNLTNKRYYTRVNYPKYYPLPGRTFSGGITISL